jgi:hypothetical protein
VAGFSEASQRRLRRVASEAGEQLVSQFCLTYHETRPGGEAVKAHLNAWLTWLRRRVPGLKYLWVLEFQKRGVPHFHVFLNVPVCTQSTLHPDMAYQWHKVTGETSIKHLDFHWHAKNWIKWDMGSGAYVCKYLDKKAQKSVPDAFGWPGRFWGCSRALMPEPCVYDVHEVRALGGQNVEKAAIQVPRETHGRDITATVIKALGDYQKSKWRRYGRHGKHLSNVKSSRWIQDGAAVMWKVIEAKLGGNYGTLLDSGRILSGGKKDSGFVSWSKGLEQKKSPQKAESRIGL